MWRVRERIDVWVVRAGLIASLCVSIVLSAQEPLTAIRTARGFSAGRLVDPIAVFPPTATVFVTFQHAGLVDGTEVQSAWYFMSKDGPVAVGDAAAVVQANGPIAALSVAPPPGGWREGQYRVVLLVDAQQAGVVKFTVSAATAGASVAKPAPAPPSPATTAASAPASAPAPPAAAAATRSGFSATPPPDWNVDRTRSDVELRMSARISGDGTIDVSSTSPAVNGDPQTLAAAWESANVGRGKTYTVRLRSDAATIAGQRAFIGVYAGAGVYAKVAFVAAPGRGVTIIGTFLISRFMTSEPLFDQMLRTATLTK
ncbi:MAG: hypothetical protein WCQ64_02620 [Acidobacteriota bacterium]